MTQKPAIPTGRWLLSLLTLAAAIVPAAPAEAALPPVGRTFYTVVIGLEDRFDIRSECFEFHQDKVCSLGGLVCGSWEPDAAIRREMGLTFDLTTVTDGDLMRLEGRARLDGNGRRSSLAGTGYFSPVEGDEPGVNFSFAAREIGRSACLNLLEDSPGDDGGPVVVGSGNILTEEREVDAFHAVVANGVGLLEIRSGATESLRITADDNILPLLTSEVSNGRLRLSSDGRFNTESNIRFEITVPDLDELVLAGVLGAEATGIDTDVFRANISGVSAAGLSGRAERQEVVVAGVSRYDARGLASRIVQIDVTGPSSAVVRVSDALRGSVLGGATLEYIGNPTLDVTVGFGSTLKKTD